MVHRSRMGTKNGVSFPRRPGNTSDVIIVGGGLAGSTLAVLLGQQGLEVELFEQSRFPRDKPCGEGLLPGGVDVLRALGLDTAVGGCAIRGIRYHVGAGTVRAGFPERSGTPRLGLGQRRLVLDHVLWQAAAATPGVHAHEGSFVEGPLQERSRVTGVVVEGEPRRAAWVVAADGSSSTLRRKLGLERALNPRRVGARLHFQRAAGQVALDDVQIFVRPGYEIYVTPLPHDELLVAVLAGQEAVGGSLRRAFSRWLEAEPLLQAWLEGATVVGELAGRAPLLRTTRAEKPPHGLTLLGDASTSVDPITAGGMTLALTSASLLALQLPHMLGGSRRAERCFELARRRATRVHRVLGSSLVLLGRHPRAANRARALMCACPSLMRGLVSLASGTRGMRIGSDDGAIG